MPDMSGMMWMMAWWWFIVLLVVIALVVALVMLLGRSSRSDASREELRARYARGEITREEYEERDAVLSGRRLAPRG